MVQISANLHDEKMICWAMALVLMKRNMENGFYIYIPTSIQMGVALAQTLCCCV